MSDLLGPVAAHHPDTHFFYVANLLTNASGHVIWGYFKNKLDIVVKDDLNPMTIADKQAEEAMGLVILGNFPSHALCLMKKKGS